MMRRWIPLLALLFGMAASAAHAEDGDRTTGVGEVVAEKLLAAYQLEDWERFDEIASRHWISGFRLAHEAAQAYWRGGLVGDDRASILEITERIARAQPRGADHVSLLATLSRWRDLDETAWARERRLALAHFRLHLLWRDRQGRTILRLAPRFRADMDAAPGSLWALFMRINVAAAHQWEGEFDRSRAAFIEVGRIAEQAGWTRPAIYGYHDAFRVSQSAEERRAAGMEAWRVASASKDDMFIALVASWHARQLLTMQRVRAALDVLAVARPAAERAKFRRAAVHALGVDAHLAVGELDEALTASEAVLAVGTSTALDVHRIEGRLARARVRLSRGEMSLALRDLERGLALAERAPSPHLRFALLIQMARCRMALGQPHQALGYARQAEILGASIDGTPAWQADRALADAEMTLERWDQAQAHIEKALSGLSPEQVVERSALEGRLALLARKRERWQEADRRYRNALALIQDAEQGAESRRALEVSSAALLVESQRHEEALPRLRGLLASTPRQHVDQAVLQSLLARAALRVGRYREALDAAKRACAILLEQIDGLAPSDASPIQRALHRAVGVGLQSAVSVGERVAHNTPWQDDVLWLSEVGRGLQLSMSLQRARVTEITPSSLEDAIAIARARIRRAQQRALSALRSEVTAKERAGAESDLEAARAMLAMVLRRVREVSAGTTLIRRLEFVSREGLQSLLGPADRYVAWHVAGERLLAVVVSPSRVALVPCGPAAGLLQQAAILRQRLDQPGVALGELPGSLHQRMLGPLASRLAGASRIWVSLAVELEAVPLAVLAGPSGRPWSFDQQLLRVPSATSLWLLRESKGVGREGAVLGLGDPRTAPYLPRLPKSASEVHTLLARAPKGMRHSLLREHATISRLESALSSQGPWRVVHLACHGLFDAEAPERSGLVLTGPETWSVQAITSVRIRSDLVVLSACDSARGAPRPGEGLIGLPRAFLWSGARAVLASSWRVGDGEAARFFADFYRLYLGEGSSAAAALHGAQEAARTRGAEAHVWAAFELWGVDPMGR